MLGTLEELAVNLTAAIIGVIAGSLWHRAISRRRFRGSRRFWQPFVSSTSIFVTGNISANILSETFPDVGDQPGQPSPKHILPALQDHMKSQELSGLMGRGDHDAVVEIQAGLARIGLRSTLPELVGSPSVRELEKNLIVVGGPDVNSLTQSLLERLSLRLVVMRNKQGRNIVRDLIHEQDYEPRVHPDNGKVRDYGILVRAPNPYARDKQILIMAGAHGFGSFAAAAIAFEHETALERQVSTSAAGFECLVCHQRDGFQEDAAFENSIVFLRELSA